MAGPDRDPWSPWQYEDPYDVVVLDPPWLEQGGGKSKRGADKHYPLVQTACMPELIIKSPKWKPSRDAHMYMWVTNNFLEDGLWLMDVLGFRYITNVAWVKLQDSEDAAMAALGALEAGVSAAEAMEVLLISGIGQYFRGEHELLLFGVRKGGSGTVLRTEEKGLGTVLPAARGEHSAKPESSFSLIERRSGALDRPTKFVEFFAREAREGWDSFGNEVPDETS